MMKAYESYKNVDLPWLKRVPEHWGIARNKNFLSEQKTTVGDNFANYSLLSLTLNGVIIRDVSNGKGKFPASFNTYKIVSPGNMIFCLFDIDETPRTVGLSTHYGMITNAYEVLGVHNINPQYLYYYYLQLDNRKALKPLYHGLRKTISVGTFLQTKLPVPPKEEQDQIVRYLDWQNSRLNKLINAKKKEIALLEEQKQALISQAVTKGLDPNVPLKDSGIDWIGQIPEHWEKSRLKECTIFLPSFAHNNISLDTVVTFTPMECIKSGHFVPGTAKLADMKQYTYYGEGDVVIAKVSPCFENGNIAIMRGLSSGIGFGSSELFVYRPIHINTDFLFFWLQNHNFKQKAQSTMTGTGGLKRVSASFMKDSPIYIPPIDEQKYISNYLYNRCVLIDNLIVNINKTISLLQEYRTRLVADVVTGQIDVRNIAIPNYETVTETIDQPETAEDESAICTEDQ